MAQLSMAIVYYGRVIYGTVYYDTVIYGTVYCDTVIDGHILLWNKYLWQSYDTVIYGHSIQWHSYQWPHFSPLMGFAIFSSFQNVQLAATGISSQKKPVVKKHAFHSSIGANNWIKRN